MAEDLQTYIQNVRATAAEQGRRTIEILEETSGLSPQMLTEALAKNFSYQLISLNQMLEYNPAFDCISFSEALQRECVALRAPDDSILPPSPMFLMRTFLPGQPNVSHAHSTCACPIGSILQPILPAGRIHASGGFRIDFCIRQRYHSQPGRRAFLTHDRRDASPVVKLVRSTLYDALKAEASDIHLETLPHGLAIKYRLDGVMSQVGAVSEQTMADQVISRI